MRSLPSVIMTPTQEPQLWGLTTPTNPHFILHFMSLAGCLQKKGHVEGDCMLTWAEAEKEEM